MAPQEKICNSCHRVFRTETDFYSGTSRWRLCAAGNLWFNCSCNSTLMLLKGKFDWYRPTQGMSAQANSVFNRLGFINNLPRLPSSIFELQQLLDHPGVDAKTVAGKLRGEPATAAQVMQIAENLRRSRNPETPKITSIEHAVVYVGFRSIGEIAVSASLRSVTLPASGFDPDRFWRESFTTGILAEYLQKRHQLKVEKDHVFLAGALANVGKVVTAFCFPPITTRIWREVHETSPGSSWSLIEAELQLPDHRVLGEIAASLWGFPTTFTEVIQKHHDLPGASSQPITLAELVAFANQMQHAVHEQPNQVDQTLLPAYLKRFGYNSATEPVLRRDLTALVGGMVI